MGMQRGMANGMRLGATQGKARLLLRQLRLRFGEISEPVRDKVESAEESELVSWSERVLSAETLDEVFD